MNASIIKLVQDIRGSYWFLPTLMAVGAIGLSFATTYFDSVYGADWFSSKSWLFYNNTDGARSTLTAIAGSMITVAGVTFSMTMVAVSFASAEFGPRLIGNFMRDRGNQVTLGTFISTFVYSLLVLSSVREADANGAGAEGLSFVPQLSVLTAIALSLASVGVLIYFIHHIPETINIGNITARLGADLKKSVNSLFPEELGEEEESATKERVLDEQSDDFIAVEAHSDGYLQAIDQDAILHIATKDKLLIRIQYGPGDFVVGGSVLAEYCSETTAPEDIDSKLRSCFASGKERTSTQDTLFLVDQLVEIMIRALSPGVNDPFTAANCIDWLRAALQVVAQREIPRSRRIDADGQLRVITYPISFERFSSAIFDQTRQYVAADSNAALKMMAVIGEVAAKTREPERQRILLDHAKALADASEESLPESPSRKALAQRYSELRALLQDKSVGQRMRNDQSWFGGRA